MRAGSRRANAHRRGLAWLALHLYERVEVRGLPVAPVRLRLRSVWRTWIAAAFSTDALALKQSGQDFLDAVQDGSLSTQLPEHGGGERDNAACLYP